MVAKQTQGPVLATYGRAAFNPLAAKVGGKGPFPSIKLDANK